MIRYLVALATMAMFCHAATLRAQRVTRLDESSSHMDIIHRKLTRTSIDQRSVPFKEVVKPSGGNPVLATVSLSAVSNAATPQDRTLTAVQGKVTTLQLINADTDEVIINLKDKMVIALDAIPGMIYPSFNINALVSGNDVRSVQFGYNGNPSYNTETTAPYSFCRNDKSDFFSCDKLGLGNHTVTVTPRNRKGQAGTSVTVTFTVIETDATEPVVVSFKALSPTTVNVTKGSVNITFELKVFDESSGFNSGLIAYPFTDPYIDDFFYPVGIIGDFVPRPSLTASGIVTVVFNMRIRPYQRPGTFGLDLSLFDNIFNFANYDTQRLASLGFPSNITIINSIVDTTLPTVLNFTALTPLKVKASNDTAPFVDFELVVKDDLSGIDSGYVRAGNKKFDPLFYPCVGSFGKDSLDQVTPELPAGIPLKFRIRMECDTFLPPIDYFMELFVSDGALNFLDLNSTDLAKRGYPSVLTLV
jgi:hypothetical protein